MKKLYHVATLTNFVMKIDLKIVDKLEYHQVH